MRWIRFEIDDEPAEAKSGPRIGIQRPDGSVIDLAAAALPHGLDGNEVPDDIVDLLGLPEASRCRLLGLAADAAESACEPGCTWQHAFDRVKLLAPIARPGKIICIGLNYLDHAKEAKAAVPTEPIFFSKYATSIIGPGGTVQKPGNVEQLDFEVELAVVIGKRGRHIPEEEALEHVFGYTILNDISARDLQFSDGQWVKGKCLDTFAPVGPAIVTRDEIPSPDRLRLSLSVNGEKLQEGCTADMIFDIRKIISYLSSFCTLEPGDLIATGTPPGVALGRGPEYFLRDGDLMVAEIDYIGSLANQVADYSI
jgi:2-keto-4-pentenoate hydratase/2-oxohepta-3-ene-1,7-dioic acid hydratase in catechol pathway